LAKQLTQQEIDGAFKQHKSADAGPSVSKIVFYDFRRPDRISKSQVRALQLMHEDFARNLSMSLGVYLRSFVTVNVTSVEQLKYGEFLEGISPPTCIISVSLRPYDGNAVIEVTTSLIFPILDLILGGKGKDSAIPKREITIIEKSLLDTFFRLILTDLQQAWKGVALINFKMEAIETDPQMLQMVAPDEAVVAIGIEVRVGDNSGMLNLAIPALNIKMIGQKFDQQWMSRKVIPTEAGQTRMLELLRPAELICDARLLGPTLKVRDLLAAEVGDCLQFDFSVNHRLDLLFNGTSKFWGEVTGKRNHRAFTIEQPTVDLSAPPPK
jgi:flagellar motor switch protein FliM